jgi:RimJ/RimL family protein N-acetyltransferase
MYPEKLICDNERTLLINHFKRLGPDDRFLRFGYQVHDEQIEQYVTSSFNVPGNQWFGLFDGGEIIAAIHVAIIDADQAEMGLSVDRKCRQAGIGQSLFNRGLVWARARGATQIYMQCLSENKIMQHIAKKNGMMVATICPTEKEARLEFPITDFAAPFNDLTLDRITAIDKIYKTQQKFYMNMFKLYTKGTLK